MKTSRLLPIAALFTLFACGGDKAPETNTNAAQPAVSKAVENDITDVSKYHLTMEGMDKYFQAQRNVALAMKDLSPAEREAAGMHSGADATINDMVAQVERNPTVITAIRKAGLSPREYILITVSYMQSAMAAAVMKMQPKANQDSLAREMKANLENIRFITDNEAELSRKAAELEAEMKRLGVTEEG